MQVTGFVLRWGLYMETVRLWTQAYNTEVVLLWKSHIIGQLEQTF